MSRRVKLTVAYDGTDYCGWQIQPNGITVEEVLNKKISKLTGEDIRMHRSKPYRFRCACTGKCCRF